MILVMNTHIKRLTEEASRLSPTERAELVEHLLATLDKPDPEIDRLWVEECERRLDAYLDGKLAVIGNRGTVLQSGRFVTELEPPVFMSGTGLRVPFKGVVNHTYEFQASTNFMNWTRLLTFTNLTERGELMDLEALQLPQRFYRLVEP